uniref:Poly ADP-ribose polymerase PARP n=1 Tax=Rhizophora mucronata TaxID=61149 RepID=A0A2P2JHQ5_RHIMU
MNGSKQPERPPVLTPPDAEPSRWPNTRKLGEGEMVFSIFKDFFMSGIKKTDPGAAITAIYQFNRTDHLGKARHDVFEKQIELTTNQRGASNMVFAWHGTSAQRVEGILARGFTTLNNVPLLGYFGSGVYLSPLGLPHLG